MTNEAKLNIAISVLKHISDNVDNCAGCRAKVNHDAELARHYEEIALEALKMIQFSNDTNPKEAEKIL